MAVPNTFAEKATKFLPVLDEIYVKESFTSILEASGVQFTGTRKIKKPKIALDGAGDYDRTNGYTDGAASVEYGEYELEQDRGRRFRVDILDDDEAAFALFRALTTEFVRTKEVPEVDAYRFSKIAALAGHTEAVNYTAGQGLTAFDSALEYMTDAEVNTSDLVMFASSDYYTLVKQDPNIQRRLDVNVNNEKIKRKISSLDDVPVIVVPKGRFYDTVQLLDGKTTGQEAGGFTPAPGAKGLNFILAPKRILEAVTKRNNTKIIKPEDNQFADAYDVMYRYFHDLIVDDNKRAGIYVSTKA